MHLGRIIQARWKDWSTTIRHSRPCNTIPLTIMEKITEESSHYDHLEQKSVLQLLTDINAEDQTVALAVAKTIPQLERLVTQVLARMQRGGRLFYIGAGTSGRLGVLDASELPPTYGCHPRWSTASSPAATPPCATPWNMRGR